MLLIEIGNEGGVVDDDIEEPIVFCCDVIDDVGNFEGDATARDVMCVCAMPLASEEMFADDD